MIALLALTLSWSDPDLIGEHLRAGTAWTVSSTDPFILASAGQTPNATFRNRFITDAGAFVIQIESQHPVAVIESGKTISIEGAAATGVFRPERRSSSLDLLASIPALPPIFVADQTEFQKRLRTLSASVPLGCQLQLRWLRPVIGLASVKATEKVPLSEPEIDRFSRVWMRPEYGMRLNATWQTPVGEFRQESRVYARNPIGFYATEAGFSLSADSPKVEMTLQQGLRKWAVKSGPFPTGFDPKSTFLLTGYEDGAIVWAAEPCKIRTIKLTEKLPDSDPIPISFGCDEKLATVKFTVNGATLERTLTPKEGRVQFVLPSGKDRRIDSISGEHGALTALVPANFA